MGTVNNLHSIDQRKPFLDNKVIEFIYSIPDEYRKNNKLYSAMLLKFFPQFYKDIPWQKTGKTIQKKVSNNLISKLMIKAKRIPYKLGILKDTKSYVLYSEWIKDTNCFRILSDILERKTSVYQNYTDADFKKKYLLPHVYGINDYSEEILRCATFEVYLRAIERNK